MYTKPSILPSAQTLLGGGGAQLKPHVRLVGQYSQALQQVLANLQARFWKSLGMGKPKLVIGNISDVL